MRFYDGSNGAAPIPIFNDIANCQLANISWVIPDLAWSDHPSFDGTKPALGPSWVADIVNAIGNSYQGGKCDYWGTYTGPSLSVEPTAVFVVWDDWGGFYDHVPPYEVLTGSQNGSSWNCPLPARNQWGCGYTYGFRVPFMVVSEFTGTKSGSQYSGYISGACGTAGTPPCPNLQNPYIHDFGSILAFTEHNFSLSIIDTVDKGYADNNALDNVSQYPSLRFFLALSRWATVRAHIRHAVGRFLPKLLRNNRRKPHGSRHGLTDGKKLNILRSRSRSADRRIY